MDSNDADREKPPVSSKREEDALDRLVEQMSSVLRLANRSAEATRQQQRIRRFSDADRASLAISPSKPEPTAVRSSDGSRWLPAPDEQTRTVGTRAPDSSETEQATTVPLQQHACDAAICAVTTLFETTELLELILNLLPTKDILSLRRTNSHWNSTIQHSPHLRLHFFYYPQFTRPADTFQLLPLKLPGLSIELGEPLHLGQWIHISFTPEAARKISPDPQPGKRVRSRSIFEGLRGGLGSKAGPSTDPWPVPSTKAAEPTNSTLQYEDLFLTQPPVVGMQAFIVPSSPIEIRETRSEEDINDDEPGPCAKLSCDAGITLGFLAETAQSLASSRREAGEGKVMFKAIVSFRKNDTALRKRTHGRSVTRIG